MLKPTAKELIHIIDRRKRDRHILSIQPGVPPANCDEQDQMRKDFYDAPVDLRSQPGPTTKADLQDAREYAATPEGQAEILTTRRYDKSGLVRNAVLEVMPHIDYSTLDDVENTVWLQATSSSDTFNGESSFDTWLVSVAKRVAVDHVRKERAAKRGELVTEGVFRSDEEDDRPYYEALIGRTKAGAEFKEVNDSAEQCAAAEMMMDELQAFLSSLPNSERQVGYMTYVQGATDSEIAETLRISVNTVKGYLKEVRAKLRTDTPPFRGKYD